VSFFSATRLTRRPWFEDKSLALEAGEILVVRGATGSGKTLFLRALADLDPVDGGEVLLDGAERAELSPGEWRRQVLYLRQRATALTGAVKSDYERVLELAGTRERAAELPAVLPLDAKTERLSGGELQWLALERALLVEPKVLLLDEASSALDRDSAARFEARVLAYVAEGHAALWVAHDGSLAERLGAKELSFP